MSVQRSRPIDALQRIMNSFKHFEKKLDKLQDDVNFHGQTLTELRTMVTNLSGGTIASADGRSEDDRRPVRQTAAIQYEDRPCVEDSIKTKRKNAVQHLPNKLKAKSFPNQKNQKISPITSPMQLHTNIKETSSKLSQKHSIRHRKAEAPRKATTIRTQKVEKKRIIRKSK